MTEAFIGSIKIMGCTFIVQNYAACNGALLAISSNQALYSLLGTRYDGDGRTSFGLPDFRGRAPIQPTFGNTTNGSYQQGQRGGYETITLAEKQIPSHTHEMQASSGASGNSLDPYGKVLGSPRLYINEIDEPLKNLNELTIRNEGESKGHNNMMPYVVVNFQMATQGIYPSRS